MIRAAIIENEIDAQELLSKIIDEYCIDVELVGIASNITDGQELLESTKPDLVFFDIEIDGGSSFQLLDNLKSKTFKIIFTTAYDQYALKAFKYGAVDYLLKPYSPQDVLKSLERVRKSQYDETIFNRLDYLIKQNQNSPIQKVKIPTSEGISIVSINDVVRLEADRSYCYVYLSDNERVFVSKPLKDIELLLPDTKFFRVHSTHLVNMDYIKKYSKEDGGFIVMNDGSKIPLARRRKQDFLDLLSNL